MTQDQPFPESWWEGPGARLLQELDAEPPAGDFEEQVLALCQAPLRRRRHLRRARALALGGILFLGGVLLGRQGPFLTTTTAPAGGAHAEAPGPGDDAGAEGPRDEDPSLEARDPAQVEMLAEVRPEAASAEDLRRAGDQFLNDRYDVSGAMRCYRRYLERLPEAERDRLADDDTWLLASLRRAL